jgi:glycosyltransferase involved in cell wall biosynthesis
MTRKKVLCVINSISAGGAERVLRYIARYYQRERFSLEICVLYKTGKENELIPPDVPVHFLRAESAGWYGGALIRLVLLIKRLKPSLLFSVLFKSNVIAAVAGWATGIPVVMSEHGPTHVYIKDYTYPRLARMIMKRAYTAARNLVVVSQAGRESIISLFPQCRDRIVVVHNGVDIDDIQSKTAQGKPAISVPYLVSCGRLSQEKNYSLLIEAVAALKRTYSLDYQLCIVGEGNERNSLSVLARRLGVELLLPGFLDNPYPVMAGAKVFVLTSRYESFPMVALEAMACGTPVVAVDCPGGIREVLRDGENCLISASFAPEDIAKALRSVLTDGSLASRLKSAATEDVKQRFTVQKMVDKYEDILSKES